jgi:hypothetical protein
MKATARCSGRSSRIFVDPSPSAIRCPCPQRLRRRPLQFRTIFLNCNSFFDGTIRLNNNVRAGAEESSLPTASPPSSENLPFLVPFLLFFNGESVKYVWLIVNYDNLGRNTFKRSASRVVGQLTKPAKLHCAASLIFIPLAL